MSKWKNYGLWVSIISIVAFVLGNWGLYDSIGMTSESFQQLANLILGALATAGVISNPTTGKMYKD